MKIIMKYYICTLISGGKIIQKEINKITESTRFICQILIINIVAPVFISITKQNTVRPALRGTSCITNHCI